MEKQTVFIKRYPSRGKFPKQDGIIVMTTNYGILTYSKTFGWVNLQNYTTKTPEWWLEEIELPSEEFFIKEVERLTSHSLNKDWRETISLGYLTCANFILNKLKGETK